MKIRAFYFNDKYTEPWFIPTSKCVYSGGDSIGEPMPLFEDNQRDIRVSRITWLIYYAALTIQARLRDRFITQAEDTEP